MFNVGDMVVGYLGLHAHMIAQQCLCFIHLPPVLPVDAHSFHGTMSLSQTRLFTGQMSTNESETTFDIPRIVT